jgi:hypothetical protein
LYQSGLPEDEILKRRAPIFLGINEDYAKLKPTLSGLERFDLDREKLNNAVLLNYLLYFHDLDNFAALQRINQGDLKRTIKQIIELAKSDPDDPFYAIWRATLNVPHATPGVLPSVTPPPSVTPLGPSVAPSMLPPVTPSETPAKGTTVIQSGRAATAISSILPSSLPSRTSH